MIPVDKMLRLKEEAARHPYPLLFATVSGAHLYGFPSPDSDFDLRGVHLLPLEDVVGLREPEETVQTSSMRGGMELDLVTHDAKKFFGLMLKKNGYVLEQLYSPLVVVGGPDLEELREIGRGCITRHHSHHYFGFAANQRKRFQWEDPPTVKAVLYLYRVLLTGIHLMRTGVVEADLPTLNEEAKLPYIADLIARKRAGAEKGLLEQREVEFHCDEYQRVVDLLEIAAQESTLPEHPSAGPALNDYLVRLRLRGRG